MENYDTGMYLLLLSEILMFIILELHPAKSATEVILGFWICTELGQDRF